MPNNYFYKFTQKAQQDITSALDYISNNLYNKKASADLYFKIEKTIDTICAFPRSFHDCNCYQIDNDNIRRATIDNYILVYEISDSAKEIRILRFVYAKMDLINLSI